MAKDKMVAKTQAFLGIGSYYNATSLNDMKNIFGAILKWKSICKLSLASWWLMDGKTDKAIPIFESLIKKHPNNGPVLAMMGMAFIKQDKIEKGVKTLKESLRWIQKDDEHFSEIFAYLGYGFLLIKNYKEAIKYNILALENWNEYNIEFPKEQIYENLGLSYEKENNFDWAIESYNKGLKVNPRYTSLYERLVRAYFLSGRYHEANQQLKQMLSIDPTLESDDTVKKLVLSIKKEIKG